MKLTLEEKDDSDTYRPIDIERQHHMVNDSPEKTEIYIPNACGGETKLTIYKQAAQKLYGIPIGLTETVEWKRP